MLPMDVFGWPSFHRVYEGGGKGSSAPPPPDYRGAAQEQAAGNQALTLAQTYANRPNMNTPWGQQNWMTALTTDPSTGQNVTQWSSNIDLTPAAQEALESQQDIQMGRSNAAETLLGQATGSFQTPFRWGAMPEGGTAARAGNVSEAQQGAFAKMSDLVQPARRNQQESLEVQLANQGLPRNSEAWNRAMSQLSSQWDQQDKQILAQSLAEGRADTTTQFGMDTASADQAQRIRQQGIAEEGLRRGTPLNELNALLTGQQVNMPQMPSFTGANRSDAPNLLGAAQSLGNYNMNAAQMGGSDWGSGIAGIASLAGAAAPFFSDERLKSSIVRIGTHPIGVGVYSFLMFGVRQVGVIAQELLGIKPDLVSVHPSGYLMVDYGRL